MLASILLIMVALPLTKEEMLRNDFFFMEAMEESVISMVPDAVPPEPYNSLIIQLGNDDWRKREKAFRALFTLDPRWLFWGRRSKDFEIATRCNLIIKKLLCCSICQGSGRLGSYSKLPCWQCQGQGNLWFY